MKHLICYSPAGKPFVCVENLSCAPDAQNLYAKGFAELSGLSIVAPGQDPLRLGPLMRVEDL